MTSRFLDTNVLVYTDDHSQPEKRSTALALVKRCYRDRNAVVSTQVLQEYFVITTRKLRVEPEIARRKIGIFSRLGLADRAPGHPERDRPAPESPARPLGWASRQRGDPIRLLRALYGRPPAWPAFR